MKIGLPREIKENEYRVAITPGNVKKLVDAGHDVYVENNAGEAASFTNDKYEAAGAKILPDEEAVFHEAEMIIKVKEILPPEFGLLKEKHILFTYIHSANRRPQTEALLNSGCVAFAYEDVMDADGNFILLEPMSRIAGEVGFLTGIWYSQTTTGGAGKLVCGSPGVKPAKIVVLGAGNVGTACARLARNMGAEVVVMDTNLKKLEEVMNVKIPGVKTCFSNKANVEREIKDADIIYNCVKWFPGLSIITKDMLKIMQPKSVIVDIDAEPNGAIETSRYTTHNEPWFVVDDIRHIGIPNLPSAVANTASEALSNATIRYILEIADKGWKQAAKDNRDLWHGLDFVNGHLTFEDTANAFNIELSDKDSLLK